jgi:hypothetical protein
MNFILFCLAAGFFAGLALSFGALFWWVWKWTPAK